MMNFGFSVDFPRKTFYAVVEITPFMTGIHLAYFICCSVGQASDKLCF